MPEKHSNGRALIAGFGLSLALFAGGLLALPSAQSHTQQQAAPAAAPMKKPAHKIMCHKSDPAAKQAAVSN